MRDQVAIVGIGESAYYKRGHAPVSEFQLALQAVQAAIEDAGLQPTDVRGFVAYNNDRSEPVRLTAALGIPELSYSALAWGGGGLVCGAVETGAGAVLSGSADYVVVYRSLAQGQTGRFGQGPAVPAVSGNRAYSVPYGLMTAAQMVALRTRRFMYEYGIGQDPLAAISLTSYAHAQRNPRAVMYGRPLTREAYDNSRWVVEPFHLFDCCQENDGAAAVILTSAERARDMRQKPAFLMATSQGSGPRYSMALLNSPEYATANFKGVAARLFERAGIGPADVDVAQFYENFTGAVMMALVDCGFCAPDEVGEFCTEQNLQWPHGKLPLNTSGGNLAECYMHGLELVTEAVRQVRGTSTCQVDSAEISLVVGGPATSPVSSLILHG